ncbi:MAG: hypothetical protein JKY31_10595, partial [Rhodobacteraceae bacterium]|nr:hypothetical protein [Paracoccaceae bacterium]
RRSIWRGVSLSRIMLLYAAKPILVSIAIARALVTAPRILIFDEATSALDAESEELIQQNMAHIVKGRTTFIIAHRMSALRMVDRIISMDRGRIVEDGPPKELLKQKGLFRHLYDKQMGGLEDV